jgi:hypothetical protein
VVWYLINLSKVQLNAVHEVEVMMCVVNFVLKIHNYREEEIVRPGFCKGGDAVYSVVA